jgi:hypothetical protein
VFFEDTYLSKRELNESITANLVDSLAWNNRSVPFDPNSVDDDGCEIQHRYLVLDHIDRIVCDCVCPWNHSGDLLPFYPTS